MKKSNNLGSEDQLPKLR